MHSPRPYGLQVVNGQLSENDKTFIDHQLKKLSNQKDISELDSIRQVKDLPDGGYVILQDMGGILKAIAYKPLSLDGGFEFDGLAKLYVPMLYSGVVTKANVRRPTGNGMFGDDVGEGVGFKFTDWTRRRLGNYETNRIAPMELKLLRFVTEPNEKIVPEFMSIDAVDSVSLNTQYAQQRPSLYSGAMAEVIQIVGGYGRQDLSNIPSTAFEQYEKASFQLPQKYIEKIAQELNGVRLPGYSGIPPLDGKFQFDYKFDSTNGVVFDDTNEPWLVRISSNGVYAMPLPIIPATATSAFREYVEEVGDDELLKILDRFGAMPSGEGFPLVEDDFEAWRRAGVIIKVCDASDFYRHDSYFQGCGWSFNLSGSEGFNTAHTYEGGVSIGVSYKASFRFKALSQRGWLKTINVEKNIDVISNYLNKLISILPENEQTTLAILYKIRRVPQEDIYQRALSSLYNPLGVTSVDIDYWNNMELAPISMLKGSIVMIERGLLLLSSAHDADYPKIRFPDIHSGDCVDFSFRFDPDEFSDIYAARHCDTTMYGYYVGDDLRLLKYFYDNRQFQLKVDTNFEPRMQIGHWYKREYFGYTKLQGYFYTANLDYREELTTNTVNTDIVGTDVGWGGIVAREDYIGAPTGILSHGKYYTVKTTVESVNQGSISIGVCIPFGCRDAVLLAHKKTRKAGSIKETLALQGASSPYTYRCFFEDDGVLAFEEKVYIHNVGEYPDKGPWLTGLPVRLSGHQLSSHIGDIKVKTYSITRYTSAWLSGGLYFDIHDEGVKVGTDIPNTRYFLDTLDDVGKPFRTEVCKIVFGDKYYVNLFESIVTISGTITSRYKWGHTSLVDHKSSYHFIGVINE